MKSLTTAEYESDRKQYEQLATLEFFIDQLRKDYKTVEVTESYIYEGEFEVVKENKLLEKSNES